MITELNHRIASLLHELASRKATDLLLVEGEPVMMRVGGLLERIDGDPLTAGELQQFATATLGDLQVNRLGPSLAVAYAAVEIGGIRVAVSAARSSGCLNLQLKLLKVFAIDSKDVRLPDSLVRAVEDRGGGLVIVTGPPGCGKTTTAYALIEHLNVRRPVQIVMAEYYADWVIESKMACIQCRQVGLDAPDMLSAIHSALVQDADVLFVGEIRDVDTVGACLQAAESGKLVITQLHEPTPEAAIERLAGLEQDRPIRRLLSRHLRIVVSQRLLPQVGGVRRVPAYGVFVPDDEIRQSILEGADIRARRSPMPAGSRTLADDLETLVREGQIAPEAARVTGA